MNNKFISGMTSEYKAAAYFSSQGYSVYWSMMSQTKEDFLIGKKGVYSRVQVKTATWSKSGMYRYLQARVVGKNKGSVYQKGDFDYMVFVDDDRMWIAPWVEVKGLTSVCLDGTKEGYTSRSNEYDPTRWEVEVN